MAWGNWRLRYRGLKLMVMPTRAAAEIAEGLTSPEFMEQVRAVAADERPLSESDRRKIRASRFGDVDRGTL